MLVKQYIDQLASRGCYHFTLQELEDNLNLSKGSIRVSLSRLKGEIASPARGFYMTIPLEYRSMGSLPPDQFVPHLMQFLKIPYYVGLLSAAMYYGAAHQQPQVFQVMTPKRRRSIEIGSVRVDFHMNKNLEQCPTRDFNTPRSILTVSSPEATAIDLVSYPWASGGMSNVLTVLEELIESMELSAFKEFLSFKRETPALQRLGYIFDLIQAEEFANVVRKHLGNLRVERAMLNPLVPTRKGDISTRWKLIINDKIESDL